MIVRCRRQNWYVRFAYADPPYPGQAARWYRDHPDYAGEVDHAELVARLVRDYPDGWALSTSMIALRDVLTLCPAGVKVAVWHKPSEPPPGCAHWQWHYAWEPVIVMGGRPAPTVRNVLTAGILNKGQQARRFPGAKPPAFCRWLFALLWAVPEDELHDLFPGSGAVTAAWDQFQMQPALFAHQEPRPHRKPMRERNRALRHDRLMAGLWDESDGESA